MQSQTGEGSGHTLHVTGTWRNGVLLRQAYYVPQAGVAFNTLRQQIPIIFPKPEEDSLSSGLGYQEEYIPEQEIDQLGRASCGHCGARDRVARIGRDRIPQRKEHCSYCGQLNIFFREGKTDLPKKYIDDWGEIDCDKCGYVVVARMGNEEIKLHEKRCPGCGKEYLIYRY